MNPWLEWFIALRFLRDGRMQSVLIVAGVGVGVAVVVFLSALISGLQANLIAQTLGSQAHIVVRAPEEVARPLRPVDAEGRDDQGIAVLARADRPPQRDRSIAGWQQRLATLAATPGVIASAPVASGPAFAQRGNATRAVLVRGTDLTRFTSIVPVDRRLVAGEARLGGRDALIGAKLADDLGLGVGDKLRLTTGADVSDLFTVRGIFDLGNKDVNARWVIVSLRAAQTLHELDGGVTELDLAVADVFNANEIAAGIVRATGLVGESWMELNAQLLTGLRSQSASSLMIQVFIVLAVAMGIASVLVVSVIQRSREIGILRAMGTSRARIMRIFLIQGGIVGLAGAAIGLALGGSLALFFERVASNPDGTPTFPIALDAPLIATAITIAVMTGLVSAVLPARRAARLDPVVAIRNE
jgi:lipoprotein-releasing system permease protein